MWTKTAEHSLVCVCVFSLHYITKDSRKLPTFPSKKKEDIIMLQTKGKYQVIEEFSIFFPFLIM